MLRQRRQPKSASLTAEHTVVYAGAAEPLFCFTVLSASRFLDEALYRSTAVDKVLHYIINHSTAVVMSHLLAWACVCSVCLSGVAASTLCTPVARDFVAKVFEGVHILARF